MEHTDEWYGWQTLAVDASTVGVLSIAIVGPYDDVAPLLIPGVVAWLYATPIVHFAHRNVALGFASMGLRHASLALFVLYSLCKESHDEAQGTRERCDTAFALGLALAPVPIALDAAVFAYERVPVARVRIRRRAGQASNHWAVAPWRNRERDAWGLQLSVRF